MTDQHASDRITPFSGDGTIADRINEIVLNGAVHIEMLSGTEAWMQIGDDVFTIYVKRGKLFIAWCDNEEDLSE